VADFFQLTVDGRREALEVAAAASGRPIHLLEKDIWVVWALNHLFGSPFADHLVFKGGTSLSKAYNVIRRFSEDVDITYDIRAIASDLIDGADSPLPATRSQEKRWTKEIRSRLSQWVSGSVLPHLSAALAKQGLPATARADGEKLFIEYTALATGTGYVSPVVMLEFGARSTGEPSEVLNVVCDAAAHLPSVQFPTSASKVMRAERTFWEKATAIHVFCAQGIFRGGDRFARHWHDLARLASAGYANSAIADRALREAVADHKSIFFAEKDKQGNPIDYHAAVSGALQLVPTEDALTALADDYARMVEDGLLLDEAESFDALLTQCLAVQETANAGFSEPVRESL
jgi:hypothetical protein